MSANRYVSGFVSTTARSSKRAKAFGFCLSFCPPKVPGSTPSSRSGCMPRRLLWNPMGCSRLSSWLNAFVLTLAAPMNLLFSLSKRLRDYALERKAPKKTDVSYCSLNITVDDTSELYRPSIQTCLKHPLLTSHSQDLLCSKRGGKRFPGDVQTNAGQGGGVAEHVGIGGIGQGTITLPRLDAPAQLCCPGCAPRRSKIEVILRQSAPRLPSAEAGPC